MLLLGAWAGALSDRIDRLTLTRVSQVLQALQAFALAVLVFSGHVSVEAVYVLSAFLGIVTAIENPSRRGLITEIIPLEDLSNGMSLNTATMTGSDRKSVV